MDQSVIPGSIKPPVSVHIGTPRDPNAHVCLTTSVPKSSVCNHVNSGIIGPWSSWSLRVRGWEGTVVEGSLGSRQRKVYRRIVDRYRNNTSVDSESLHHTTGYGVQCVVSVVHRGPWTIGRATGPRNRMDLVSTSLSTGSATTLSTIVLCPNSVFPVRPMSERGATTRGVPTLGPTIGGGRIASGRVGPSLSSSQRESPRPDVHHPLPYPPVPSCEWTFVGAFGARCGGRPGP